MELDHNKVRRVVEEDRLSSLPDDLIHKILSSLDMKFVVQMCLLSSRWKLVWASMPCLNFSSYHFGVNFSGYHFGNLRMFSKFVTRVLSQRNHQVEVSSVKLHFSEATSKVAVKKVANYASSHNVQELTVSSWPKKHHQLPPCLFSSRSLKKFTLSNNPSPNPPCITPKTPWDFPALITLHLGHITLCDDPTAKSVDLFSKCVNLKNLTLQVFSLKNVKVFDIITPRLSDLILTHGNGYLTAINVIAPKLENLKVIHCSIKHMNAPPRLSSFCYKGYPPLQLSKDGFHSLNKVTFFLYICTRNTYKEEDARKTINMLQELHSAKYVTLNMNVVECLSLFPDLLSQNPSPFRNLSSLAIIDFNMKKDAAYKVKMSTEARNFLLDNSPNATFIM